MHAYIQDKRLIIDTLIKPGDEAPISKQGKSRINLTTNGWIFLNDEEGNSYRLSLNLITALKKEN